jgi:hypothetical protein
MTDQQIDAILNLASNSIKATTEDSKRWFLVAIILAITFSATAAWISYFYFRTSYPYPTISTESQSQTQSSSSKSELNINKK